MNGLVNECVSPRQKANTIMAKPDSLTIRPSDNLPGSQFLSADIPVLFDQR